MKNLKRKIMDFYKRWYIDRELKKMFKYQHKTNVNYRKHLTKSLFQGSVVVKNDVAESNRRISEYKDMVLTNGIKSFVDKYYGEKENDIKNRERKLKSRENSVKLMEQRMEENRNKLKQIVNLAKT